MVYKLTDCPPGQHKSKAQHTVQYILRKQPEKGPSLPAPSPSSPPSPSHPKRQSSHPALQHTLHRNPCHSAQLLLLLHRHLRACSPLLLLRRQAAAGKRRPEAVPNDRWCSSRGVSYRVGSVRCVWVVSRRSSLMRGERSDGRGGCSIYSSTRAKSAGQRVSSCGGRRDLQLEPLLALEGFDVGVVAPLRARERPFKSALYLVEA